MESPSGVSSSLSVHPTYPPLPLLKFNPQANPKALSPPTSGRTLTHPFTIDPGTYENALHFAVPVTFALVYVPAVLYFNRRNKERNHKPWNWSNHVAFYIFKVMHNVLLTLFSAWIFVGMVSAIQHSWPGWSGDYKLAKAADALCKMHGPRGFGSAATYDMNSKQWGDKDKTILLASGRPDSTDVGRLWNEGLAFYGWIFYLSKLYELMDTAMILARGKESSLLQTFHHTGAIFCVWAGIRFMSPPIWMFVFINSGIHTLMYTYYTLHTLAVKAPKSVGRNINILQIAQIAFGCSYALLHLFIAYDVPVQMSYSPTAHGLSSVLTSSVSTVSSALSEAFTGAAATAGVASWLKKAALRAAGEEGLAENVRNSQGELFGIDAIHAADLEKARKELIYHAGTQRIHCLDTSGEVFAILLNAVYLIPLCIFFLSYRKGRWGIGAVLGSSKTSEQEDSKEPSKTTLEAIEHEIKEEMAIDHAEAMDPPPEIKDKLEKAKSDARQGASDLSNNVQHGAQDLAEKAKDGAKDMSDKAHEATNDLPAKVQKGAQDLGTKTKDAAASLPEKIQNGAKDGAQKAKDVASDIPSKANEMGQQAKEAVNDANHRLQENLQALKGRVETGDERPKSQGKENSKPNGTANARNASPEKASKARDMSPEKKIPSLRQKSPVKKAAAPREKSPEKKATQPRDKSPEKKAPAPSDPSPQKPSEPVENPEQEPEEEKKSSPDLGASGYEMVPDEPKTEEERKAEAEMQPTLE